AIQNRLRPPVGHPSGGRAVEGTCAGADRRRLIDVRPSAIMAAHSGQEHTSMQYIAALARRKILAGAAIAFILGATLIVRTAAGVLIAGEAPPLADLEPLALDPAADLEPLALDPAADLEPLA